MSPKSISVTDAAKKLNLSEEEFRDLLKGTYKTYETIQRISTKNFAEIADNISETEAEQELETEVVEDKDNHNQVQFELVTPDAVSLESQEMNGNGHHHPIDNDEVEIVDNSFAETDSTATIEESGERQENQNFLSSPVTNGVSTERTEEQKKDNYEQSHDQAQLQREEDMKVAWKTTAEQATSFAKKLEAGYWLIVGAARSSEEVQNSPEVKEARDFALGIGDGGLQNSAHIKSVEKYLEDKGFFARLQQTSDGQKQLTD